MLTLTPRSARLTARLLVCLLFCSQVGALSSMHFKKAARSNPNRFQSKVCRQEIEEAQEEEGCSSAFV